MAPQGGSRSKSPPWSVAGQTVTNDSPLCAAVILSSVALTCFQLLSAFIRASQPCDVGIVGKVATDHFAEGEERRAEVVGDRERITAKVVVPRAEDVVVEHLQPGLRALLAPLQRGGMGLVAAAFVVGKHLRKHDAEDRSRGPVGC